MHYSRIFWFLGGENSTLKTQKTGMDAATAVVSRSAMSHLILHAWHCKLLFTKGIPYDNIMLHLSPCGQPIKNGNRQHRELS